MTTLTSNSTKSHLPIMAAAVSFSVAFSGGCYKRIVSVNNTPGYTGTVYESNLGKGKQQGNETLFQVEKKTYKGTTYSD